jgi:hypothetical protein
MPVAIDPPPVAVTDSPRRRFVREGKLVNISNDTAIPKPLQHLLQAMRNVSGGYFTRGRSEYRERL